jgi:hypothetical protein
MGFRASRQSKSRESTDSRGFASQQQAATQREQSTGAIWTHDIETGEQHFGMQIPKAETLQRLQIAEETHGQQVHDWIDEGMPAEILGRTRDMEAFRQRQANRPPEVPTDIERRNKRSVQRSEQAAAEMGVAGKTGVPDPVRDVISSSGRSLDGTIQRAVEDRMDESFGDVQIHTGSTAAAACEAINARAFTVGNHIAFNQGEYDPASPEGQHVLAHELAHVRQQTGGAVSMLPQAEMELEVDPDPQLEREAEEAAQQVMKDGPVVINRMGAEMHIQRSPFSERRDSRPQADSSGVDELVGLLTNDGVDLDEDSIQELLTDLDYTSILKKMGVAAFKTNPAGSAIVAAFDEAHGQLSSRDPTPQETLQDRLGQVDFPKQWMDDLEAMGPPKEWKTELKEYAEDVAKSVTNGENTKF